MREQALPRIESAVCAVPTVDRLSFVGLTLLASRGAECWPLRTDGRGVGYRYCGSSFTHRALALRQTAFSVLVFLSVLWPDYSLWHLLLALLRFQREYPPLRVRPAPWRLSRPGWLASTCSVPIVRRSTRVRCAYLR